MRLLQIVKLAPHVRPARRLLDAAVFVKLIESGIGIGLQPAAELAQVPLAGAVTLLLESVP